MNGSDENESVRGIKLAGMMFVEPTKQNNEMLLRLIVTHLSTDVVIRPCRNHPFILYNM